MNFAAWTAGRALPNQSFSKEDPFKMSVYSPNQQICNKKDLAGGLKTQITNEKITKVTKTEEMRLEQLSILAQRATIGWGGRPSARLYI
jgi:hypothetical protein